MEGTHVKPTVPDVLPLVWELYDTDHGAVGGCLHIVLDDPNYSDSSVDFCIKTAEARNYMMCLKLVKMIRQMSLTQRKKLNTHAYCHQYRYRRHCRCEAHDTLKTPSGALKRLTARQMNTTYAVELGTMSQMTLPARGNSNSEAEENAT